MEHKPMEINELDYNTQLKRMELPEYGRNIQRMVDYAVHIEDREERAKCAQTIISIMGNLFPHLRDVPDFKHKLWDHLAIMADFKLDIDYPFEVIRPENLKSRPETVPYGSKRIKIRHYGKSVEELIEKVVEMEPGPERTRLTEMLANHMKKSIISWNRDAVEDEKIFDDLRLLSEGRIDENSETIRMMEVREVLQPQPQRQQQNRKNRKNR